MALSAKEVRLILWIVVTGGGVAIRGGGVKGQSDFLKSTINNNNNNDFKIFKNICVFSAQF